MERRVSSGNMTSREERLEADFGYDLGIGEKVYRFPEDFRILDEACSMFALFDFTPGQKKRVWGNAAYLQGTGQTLETLRTFDMNTQCSQAIAAWQQTVYQTCQIGGQTTREIRTTYPQGNPHSSYCIFRPIRVLHQFALGKGNDFSWTGEEVETTMALLLNLPTHADSEEDKDLRRSHELSHFSDVIATIFEFESEKLEYGNTKARRYYGLDMNTGGQLSLTDVWETCTWESDIEKQSKWSAVKALTLQCSPVEIECQKRPREDDTRQVWHRMVWIPTTNPVTGKFSLFLNEYDITELKQVQADLRQANVDQDAFVASLSHELRTPLNGIIGLAEGLLQDPSLSQQVVKTLAAMRTSGMRLALLVDDILDAASSKRNRLTVKEEPVDLVGVVDAVQSIVRPLLKKHVKFVRKIDAAVPKIKGDHGRLQQIVINLVSNAVKFTHKGSITVDAALQGSTVLIGIEDTGVGIPQDKLSGIFEAFAQVDAATTKQYGGTGLGLALVKTLVEAHGGSISVSSRFQCAGSGTRFELSLPVWPLPGHPAPPPADLSPQAQPPPPPPPTKAGHDTHPGQTARRGVEPGEASQAARLDAGGVVAGEQGARRAESKVREGEALEEAGGARLTAREAAARARSAREMQQELHCADATTQRSARPPQPDLIAARAEPREPTESHRGCREDSAPRGANNGGEGADLQRQKWRQLAPGWRWDGLSDGMDWVMAWYQGSDTALEDVGSRGGMQAAPSVRPAGKRAAAAHRREAGE